MAQKDYEKLFSHLEQPEPPDCLLNKIINHIRQKRRLQALKWRFPLFAVLLVGSATAAIPAFQSARSSLVESGFTQFLSLLFYDTGAVMAYWDSFASALLESFPVISIVLFLAVVFIFLESLKRVARDIRVVFPPLRVN